MTNGCICCTLRDDLLAEVRRLSEAGRFDYLLIEGTGIADRCGSLHLLVPRRGRGRPFRRRPPRRDGHRGGRREPAEGLRLERLPSRPRRDGGRGGHPHPGRSAGGADRVRRRGRDQQGAGRRVRTTRPGSLGGAGAERRRSHRRDVLWASAPRRDSRHRIVRRGKGAAAPLWFKELYGSNEHVPETEEYGISSFVYRARRPFDPEPFKAFIDATCPAHQGQGPFLAGDATGLGRRVLAGRRAVAHVSAMGFWWSAVPRKRWPEATEFRERLHTVWSEVWGDRRQELVFIGTGMDRAAITAALDACLIETGRDVTPFDPAPYQALPDPFPAWRRAA